MWVFSFWFNAVLVWGAIGFTGATFLLKLKDYYGCGWQPDLSRSQYFKEDLYFLFLRTILGPISFIFLLWKCAGIFMENREDNNRKKMGKP